MSDKELYTYFKDRRGSFEEVPGDFLWEKIDEKLNSTNIPPNKSINIFFIGLGFLAVLAIGIILMIQKRQDDDVPVTQDTLNRTTPKIPTYTKEIKTNNTTLNSNNDSVKKKKNSSKITQPRADTDKQKTPYLKFQALPNSIYPLDTIITKQPKPDYKTQIMPGRIIVTGKGKFTNQEFDLLIKETLNIHKEAEGSLIIVKAPGQETFRQKIPYSQKHFADTLTTSTTGSGHLKFVNPKDTLKTKSPEYNTSNLDTRKQNISFQETVYLSKNLTKQAEYPGGYNAFIAQIKINSSKKEIKEGTYRIHISCIVEKDGSLSSFELLKDPGYGLGEEFIKALNLFKGKWSPGEIDDKAVRTKIILPITYAIRS